MPTTTQHPHETVRELLLKMEEFGGAAIKPLALYDIFDELFDNPQIPQNQLRNVVEVYTALCNEFFVIYHFDRRPKAEFFITNERWAKYRLAQKAIYNGIAFLSEKGLIRCRKGRNPHNRLMKGRAQF